MAEKPARVSSVLVKTAGIIQAARKNEFNKQSLVILARDFGRSYEDARSKIAFRSVLPGSMTENADDTDRELATRVRMMLSEKQSKDFLFRAVCVLAKYDVGNITMPEFLHYVYLQSDAKSSARRRIDAMLCQKRREVVWMYAYRYLRLAESEGYTINCLHLVTAIYYWNDTTRDYWANVVLFGKRTENKNAKENA